jgi:hypothetical protein
MAAKCEACGTVEWNGEEKFDPNGQRLFAVPEDVLATYFDEEHMASTLLGQVAAQFKKKHGVDMSEAILLAWLRSEQSKVN